jgi:hypothetical protein
MKQSATYRFDTRRMFHDRPTVKETLKWVQVPPAGLVWKSRLGGLNEERAISFKKSGEGSLEEIETPQP